MKNTKITIVTMLLFLVSGLCSCSDWNDTESLEQRVTTPEQQDPAAYAAYAARVRAYKQTAHKIFFIAFENVERPTTPAQFLAMLPDSADIIALRNPWNISEKDIAAMSKVKTEFATRILCYVNDAADAKKAATATFGSRFDGYVIRGGAATPEVMAVLGASAGPGKEKLLVLDGAALQLPGTLNQLFDYNVQNTASASTIFEVGQQVDYARSVYGFANAQIVLASSIDATITDTDFVKRDMLSTMLTLVSDLGPLGGLAIADIESDYYHSGGNFLAARQAIKLLNQ